LSNSKCEHCGAKNHYHYQFPFCPRCDTKMESHQGKEKKGNVTSIYTYYTCEVHGEVDPMSKNTCVSCGGILNVQTLPKQSTANKELIMIRRQREKLSDKVKEWINNYGSNIHYPQAETHVLEPDEYGVKKSFKQRLLRDIVEDTSEHDIGQMRYRVRNNWLPSGSIMYPFPTKCNLCTTLHFEKDAVVSVVDGKFVYTVTCSNCDNVFELRKPLREERVPGGDLYDEFD